MKYGKLPISTGESYLEFDMGEPTLIQAMGMDEPDRWPRYRQRHPYGGGNWKWMAGTLCPEHERSWSGQEI